MGGEALEFKYFTGNKTEWNIDSTAEKGRLSLGEWNTGHGESWEPGCYQRLPPQRVVTVNK